VSQVLDIPRQKTNIIIYVTNYIMMVFV